MSEPTMKYCITSEEAAEILECVADIEAEEQARGYPSDRRVTTLAAQAKCLGQDYIRLWGERDELLAACKPVIREAEQRADFHFPDWNEDAHIELTLTIREIRAIAAAVEKAEGGAA